MLSVEPIKAYTDNYIWLVSTNEGSIVVDPGESKEILNLIDSNKIDLKGVLITHHHYDHTNGLLDLTNKMNLQTTLYNLSSFIFFGFLTLAIMFMRSGWLFIFSCLYTPMFASIIKSFKKIKSYPEFGLIKSVSDLNSLNLRIFLAVMINVPHHLQL